MLNRLPRHMPPLPMMLADIGNPNPAELSKALGVSRASVYRWMRAEQAPHAVMLALFWLTRWGQSLAHCEAHNAATLHASMAAGLRFRIKDLQAQLDQIGRIADFGAANDPTPEVRRAVPALPVVQVPGEPCSAPSATAVQPKKTARSNRGN